MNCLHFTFKNGEFVIYDADVQYTKYGDLLDFDLDSFKIKINLENFYFAREDDSSIFEINEYSCKNALVTLKEENVKFEVKLIFFEYKKLQEKYIIQYKIESDEDEIKTIIISLL